MKHWAYYKNCIVEWVSQYPDFVIPTPPEGFAVVELDGPLTAPPFDGASYDIQAQQWVDLRSAETKWRDVRQRRMALLQRSDWSSLSDVPMSPELRAQWSAYRQALRDITEQSDPNAIVWPVPPS